MSEYYGVFVPEGTVLTRKEKDAIRQRWRTVYKTFLRLLKQRGLST